MKKISMLLFALCLMFLCASVSWAEPPEDIVYGSIVNMIRSQFNPDVTNIPREAFILDDFEITNFYTKVVDNETGYLYEFKTNLKVRGWDGEKFVEDTIHDHGQITGTVALVKRGSKWYSIE